jgi:endonuclease YncB( thermonuclease family)
MLQIKFSALFYIIVLLLFSCTHNEQPLQFYQVVGISDEDTFTIVTDKNEQKKIRLYGIDSPEKGQPFGSNAKQALAVLIFKKKVRIQIEDTDPYGRIVAIVYNDTGQCINEMMLQSGLAWHYKEYDDSREWSRMEKNARA